MASLLGHRPAPTDTLDHLRALTAPLTGPGRRPAWRRRVLRRLAAAACAVGAALALVGLLRPDPPEPTVTVPVAARTLPAGTRLTPGDIRTVTVARSLAPSMPPGAVVGRVLAGAVDDGEPLRASRLLGSGPIPAGSVAVAVPVGPGIAAALAVGRRVDIVAQGRLAASDAVIVGLVRAPVGGVAGSGGIGGDQAVIAVRDGESLAVAGAIGGGSAPVLLARPTQPEAAP